jgi:hypothetical protein
MSNRNAYVLTRPNTSAQRGAYTFTKGRDFTALKVSARTTSNNVTEVVLTRRADDGEVERLVLSGAEARTLQRVLNRHYEVNGS